MGHQVVAPLKGLTPTQRDTLQRAIAPATLKTMDWVETQDGEVVMQRTGEMLHGSGYTHAIRFMLTVPSAANDSKRAGKSVDLREGAGDAIDA